MNEIRRVVLAKRVAQTWIMSRLRGEHRLRLFSDVRHPYLLSTIRGFNEGRLKLGGSLASEAGTLEVIPEFDAILIRSSSLEPIERIVEWADSEGIEHSGAF